MSHVSEYMDRMQRMRIDYAIHRHELAQRLFEHFRGHLIAERPEFSHNLSEVKFIDGELFCDDSGLINPERVSPNGTNASNPIDNA
jgi:hypothetical protein